MSIPGAVPPPIPPEVLDEEREKLRKQLEIERGKSRVLYERAYQSYLTGIDRSSEGAAKTEEAATKPEFLDKIANAYQQAYALRAFRDVMEEAGPRGASTLEPEKTAPSNRIVENLIRSGMSPTVVNSWLKGLDPEALGAIIALSSDNPNLALSTFAMSQHGTRDQLTVKDVIELNAALNKSQNAPNVQLNLAELIREVKAQPPSASTADVMGTVIEAIKTGVSLASAGRSEEKPPAKGVFETLIQTPEGIKTAKELGLIGGDATQLQILTQMRKNDQEWQERTRESDRKWDLRREQIQAEHELKLEQIRESRHRTDMIGNSLKKIGEAVADGIAAGAEETEGKAAAEEATEETEGKLRQLKCSECGAPIIIPPEAKIGSTVTCPKCNAEFELTTPSK